MKRRMIGVLAFILATCLGAYGVGAYFLRGDSASSPNPPLPTPKYQVIDGLAVETAALDLGEVWEQPEYVHELVIHNQSPVTKEIQDILPSCGCSSVEPRALKIPSGGEAIVRMKIDLAFRRPREMGLARRPIVVEIWPVGKSSAPRREGWQVHGIIKSRVTLDTAALDFGDEPVRGQSPLSRTAIAKVHIPDTKLQVKAVPPHVTIASRPQNGSADEFELTIAPKPLLEAGSFRCKVKVDLVTAAGARLSGVVLPVSGRMRPEVRALPSQVVFGPQRVGQTAEATVTLQAPAGEVWVVDHIEMESEDVRVERFTDRRISLHQTFRIRQRISRTGHQASTVRFFVRKGEESPVPLPMEVSYDGDKDGILTKTSNKGDKP